MEKTFQSVKERHQIEIERKRSRFIGIAAPTNGVPDAERLIREVEAAYPDATHHCYAYRIDLDGLVVRFSDAGEPQGTAGRPILEALERNELVNACVVVVRYFGGTLLGAAGLVRAYGAAASLAVAGAGVVRYHPHVYLSAELDYGDWSRLERRLTGIVPHILGVEYLGRVRVRMAVRKDRAEAVQAMVTEETAGRSSIQVQGEGYLP